MLIMRIKYITDCFEIGWLAGFSITIRIIRRRCIPITDSWTEAGPLRTAGGGRLDGAGKARPLWVPPYPRGGGKTGGVFQGWVGYILQPFKTTSSKQGGTGKTGGHEF